MALNRTTPFRVTNRSTSTVGYTLPEDKIRRVFAPGETKVLPYWELEKLTFQPGGCNIIADYLLIENEEAIEKLGMPTEPEYYMKRENVIKLMQEGSIEAWYDCLNYAPQGVIEMIKDLSTSLPLNDVAKRQMLKEKTGFDVDAAMANIKADGEIETFSTASSGPARRASVPNYKIVNK